MTDSEIMVVLRGLYSSEINFHISSFWDEGYSVMLGDTMNGWHDQAFGLRSWDEIAAWLTDAAIRHYPQSEFARRFTSP